MLVDKIKEIRAQSIQNLPDLKIQIRVDEFDLNEFRQINDFVDEFLFQELPSKNKKTL